MKISERDQSDRAGKLVTQATDYMAFVSPPHSEVMFDGECARVGKRART
jgi:hypothetical protein